MFQVSIVIPYEQSNNECFSKLVEIIASMPKTYLNSRTSNSFVMCIEADSSLDVASMVAEYINNHSNACEQNIFELYLCTGPAKYRPACCHLFPEKIINNQKYFVKLKKRIRECYKIFLARKSHEKYKNLMKNIKINNIDHSLRSPFMFVIFPNMDIMTNVLKPVIHKVLRKLRGFHIKNAPNFIVINIPNNRTDIINRIDSLIAPILNKVGFKSYTYYYFGGEKEDQIFHLIAKNNSMLVEKMKF